MAQRGTYTLASAVLAGCGANYDDNDIDAQEAMEVEDDLGVARQAASACLGDDVNYDFNAFAASLAVAIANELGRWDVSGDFQLVSGKLELSAMGRERCNGRCGNISALLRLRSAHTRRPLSSGRAGPRPGSTRRHR